MSRYIALVLLVIYLLGSISAIPQQKKCPPNEVVKACGVTCEPTCAVPHPKICSDLCIPDICQCAPGFVRDPAKKCVRPCECPQ